MAHDSQYKDSPEGWKIKRYDYPTVGDLYWDRLTRSVKMATHTLSSKALILDGEE